MLSKYITIFLWSFLAGLVIGHSFKLSLIIVLVILILGLFALSGSAIHVLLGGNRSATHSIKKAEVISLFFYCISSISLGFSLGAIVWTNTEQVNQFQRLTGQAVNTEGVVVGWPNLTASGNQSLMILPDGFNQALRVSLRIPIKIHPNDRVWIRGQIKQPENFNRFNYIAYLKKNNVYAELDKPKVIVIKISQHQIISTLDSLRQWIINKAGNRLTQSSSGMVLGMLIGYGDSLPKDLGVAFQKTGLTHILVASGFNLTVIASSIGVLAWLIGRRWGDVVSLAIIWAFVVLTGSSGSVVRAGIMASVILLARIFGRMPTSYFTLLLAVTIMVWINPLQLFYDIGFQLSVGATIGVLEANKLRLYLQRDGMLTELLWPTMGAILLTAPIISFYFGTFSLIAPIANLLVLPLVPLVMLLGGLTLLPWIYIFSAPITEFIVQLQVKITMFFAEWKYSSLSIESSLSFLIGYYIILFLLREAFYHYKSQKNELNNKNNSGKMIKIII